MWFQSEFRLRWVQWAVMHALLEEHCAHMAEDLAVTGAHVRSLNEKTYKPVLVTVEWILPAAHFVIVFVVAGHTGHVSGADKQIAWPWVPDLSQSGDLCMQES